jgi:hypothetical protein
MGCKELERDQNCARPIDEAEAVGFFARMARRDEPCSRSCGGHGISEIAQGGCFLLDRYSLPQPLDREHHSPAGRGYSSRLRTEPSAGLFGSALQIGETECPRTRTDPISRIRAAIAKPLKFYFAVPSIDLTNWLVVEAADPEQPMGQLFSSEAEACAVADALNDRELKMRSSDVRQAQQASENRDPQM